MLRVIGLLCLSVFVTVLAAASAEAFPEWQVKGATGPWATLAANTAEPTFFGAPAIQVVIDGQTNTCGFGGGAEAENTGGHGYLRIWKVTASCTGPTGNTQCTPASNLLIYAEGWKAELVGPPRFAVSTAPTTFEVKCAAGTPDPTTIGNYTGSLKPKAITNALRFTSASGTLALGTHTLHLFGTMELTPFPPTTKLRAK